MIKNSYYLQISIILLSFLSGCQSVPPSKNHAAYDVAKAWMNSDIDVGKMQGMK